MSSDDDAPDASRPAAAAVARLASISIDCPDPASLADFYSPLLGMPRALVAPDGSIVSLSDGTIWVTFMQIADYVAPTWPGAGQQKQLHLDLLVDDLEAAVAGALALGATPAEFQPRPDSWRVLLDPVGHPFCLTTVTSL